MKIINIIIPILLLLILFFALNFVLSDEQKQKVDNTKLVGKTSESTQNAPKKAIVEWIEEMIVCESGGNTLALGDNGKAHGILQFHEPTFWAYNEKYKILSDLERGEVPNVIFDEYVQRELTKRILLEDEGWRNWYNCSKIIGLDRIDLNG